MEVDVCPLDSCRQARPEQWWPATSAPASSTSTASSTRSRDRCSHDDGPLCQGAVDWADHTVICPRHGSKFEIKTGRVLNPPAYAPVETFEVRVDESGMIKVDITDD